MNPSANKPTSDRRRVSSGVSRLWPTEDSIWPCGSRAGDPLPSNEADANTAGAANSSTGKIDAESAVVCSPRDPLAPVTRNAAQTAHKTRTPSEGRFMKISGQMVWCPSDGPTMRAHADSKPSPTRNLYLPTPKRANTPSSQFTTKYRWSSTAPSFSSIRLMATNWVPSGCGSIPV